MVTLKFQRAAQQAVLPHVMVWGSSGMGKTACGVRALKDLHLDLRAAARGGPQPVGDPGIFLLTGEPNAIETARAVNPQCAMPSFGVTTTGAERSWFESKAEAWEILRAAKEGELAAAGFHTLVLDGFTELQRQIAAELNRSDDAFWMELGARTTTLLRLVRSIPMVVVATALEKTKENAITKVVHVEPSFELTKAPGEAMSTMAAVARMTRVGDGDAQRYAADCNLPSRFAVKECGPLSGRILPCAQGWVAVIKGELHPSEIRFAGPNEAAEPAAPAAQEGAVSGSGRKVARD
jgi:hypothetical protein